MLYSSSLAIHKLKLYRFAIEHTNSEVKGWFTTFMILYGAQAGKLNRTAPQHNTLATKTKAVDDDYYIEYIIYKPIGSGKKWNLDQKETLQNPL